ncbi:MAG: hypothetical protein HKO77_03770 [Gemmatimonadetes bacterium]|nr:hypothetical protein [Gemmatimonadota bacterium]
MYRSVWLAALAMLVGAPLAGQDEELSFPDGWQVRFDREGSSMEDLRFVTMPPGMHVTTGPAMIAYHPDSTASGSYPLESEVFLFDPENRREGFGFFVGGTDLDGANQSYTYFLLRQGGEFLVKVREGAETRVVHDWTANDAIHSWTDGEGATAQNLLTLRVGDDGIAFMVNDAVVWEGLPGSVATSGVFGLRINHGLNLHVTSITAGASETDG